MADEAAKADIYEPQSFSVDDLDLDSTEEETIEGAESTSESDEEPEIEVEGKSQGTIETEETESDKLRKELSGLKDEILKLSARREEKPLAEPISKEPEKLTRTQIAQILKEHKDDPEVLLNVIDYMAEQKAMGIKDDTVKDLNYKQWHTQLAGTANRLLADDEDGYLAANPAVSKGLDDMAQNLGLGNHPIGRLAAYSIYRYSELVKAKGSKGAEPTESKPTTNKRVMDKTRTSSSSTKNFGLTEAQLTVAKKFGVKPETYAKFVRRP
jgi:hypothetical protein